MVRRRKRTLPPADNALSDRAGSVIERDCQLDNEFQLVAIMVTKIVLFQVANG